VAGAASAAMLLLAACAGRDPYVSTTVANTTPVGEWRIERQLDRITSAPISSAVLTTRQVSNGNILFPPPALMQLMCFKERPAVVFEFAFKIGSTRNAELGYRFDDKPGHEPRVRVVENYKTVVIEDPKDVMLFASELAASDSLYIRVRSLTAARTSAEFKVAGAPPAIAAAYASCPLTAAARTSATPPAGRVAEED
jgi:hypothetical protein